MRKLVSIIIFSWVQLVRITFLMDIWGLKFGELLDERQISASHILNMLLTVFGLADRQRNPRVFICLSSL